MTTKTIEMAWSSLAKIMSVIFTVIVAIIVTYSISLFVK